MVAWIDGWYAGLGPGLRAVLTASWQASVLVVLVLSVHTALGRWLSPRWRYALWSVVVLRLMLPVTPGSAMSVFNLFRGNPEVVVEAVLPTVSVAAPMDAIDLSGFDTVAYAAGVPEEYEPVSTWSTAEVALTAWLIGAGLVLGVLLLVNVILALRLRRGAVLNDPGLLELVESCKREMGVRRSIRLLNFPGVSSPALAGVFRPTLLIPPGLLDDLPREELRFILLHELAHVKKHDIAMNWLLIALTALHWFNPLMWFAFSRLRADRELARDAMVLRAAGADASQAYGQTIIRILERLTRPRLANPALAGIGDGMGQLKRRLRMIALAPKRRPALTVVGALLLATLAAIGLTDAAEPGEKEDLSIDDLDKPIQSVVEGSGADIVRDARAGEEWIHHVDSFYARFEIAWAPGSAIVTNNRPGLTEPLPIAELKTDPLSNLKAEQKDSLVLAFDDNRLLMEWLQPDRRRDHRVWDGELMIAYEYYSATGQELYGLDDDPKRSIGRRFLTNLNWLRGTTHHFWWDEHPNLVEVIYGRPEEWTLAGRESFLGIDCYVLERRLHKLYVGIDDHRVHGFAQFAFPPSAELSEARQRLAKAFGSPGGNTAEISQWEQSLAPDERKNYDDAYYEKLRPYARLQSLHKLMDYQEVAPGCWFPMRQGYLTYKTDGQEEKPVVARRELVAVEVKVNQPLDAGLFTMNMKEGVRVIDRRQEPEQEYEWKEGALDIENGLTDAAERVVSPADNAPEATDAPPTRASSAEEAQAGPDALPEAAAETRVYDIHDLLVPDLYPDDVPSEERPTRAERLELLANAITETVGEPHEWSVNGGDKSSIVEFGDKLVIRTSAENHAQIEALLTMLRSGDPGRPGDGWRARFDAVYRLEEGEVVRRIAPPFIPERMEYYRHETEPSQVAAIPAGPDVMFFRWNNKLDMHGMTFGADMTIERLLNYVLDLYTYEYVGDRALLDVEIPGDWVYDFDADDRAKREALIRVIEGATGRRLRIESKPMERDVILAEGRWRFTPLDAAADNQLMHVYAGDRFDPSDRRGAIHGDLEEFFRRTGWELGVRIEDRVTERPEGWSLEWWWYPSSRLHEQDMNAEQRSARLRSLLDNLSKQTGLTFTVERRVEDVWEIGE